MILVSKRKDVKKKKKQATCEDRTHDLLITSQMHYHYAKVAPGYTGSYRVTGRCHIIH